jgi:spore coat protein H
MRQVNLAGRLLALVTACTLLLGALPASAGAEEEDYHKIFEKDRVVDVSIEINEEDWQSMKDNARLEEYHSANITIDGVTVENVGIRTKGNISLQAVAGSDSDRYSFRIKFDKYEKGQSLLGLDELCLNNMYADASYMREYLHYEVLRAMGCNVPETVFTNISINGELFGFYLGVEALDNTFLEENFGENYKSGNFYKMDMGASLQYEEGSNYDYAELKKGDDIEKTGLKNMIQVLDQMPEGEKGDIESVLDVDSALKYIAGNTVMGNYDSYNGNMHHNYYLYQNTEGVFTVVPWDFNMSFGCFGGDTSVGVDTPIASGSMESLPMIKNLLAVPEYKERYYSYIQQMMELLEPFEERVNELAEIIRPYVEADPRKFYTMEQFEKAITYSEDEEETSGMGMGGGRPQQEMGEGQMMPPEGGQPPEMGTLPDFMGGPGGMDLSQFTEEQWEQLQERSQLSDEEFSALKEKLLAGDEEAIKELFGGHGGGMPGNQGTNSIVTYVVRRLANLEAQFAGEADKETYTGSGFDPEGGGRPGHGGKPGQNGQQAIRIVLDGEELSLDQSPVIQNDRTLVPFRAVLEALGANVEWDAENQQVTAEKDGIQIQLTIGSTSAFVNGISHELDAPAVILNDRTLIPVRFVAEQLGLTVEWQESERVVTIISSN